MKNIPLKEVARLLGLVREEEERISTFQIDSRKIGCGDLFFALKGENTNGHLFLDEVAAKGAIAAVVSGEYKGVHEGLILLPVDDVLMSLQALARHFVRESGAKVVAITGSMGKTTTKDFLATLLEKKFRVGKSYASYNTRLTLPITILNMNGDEEIIILEMGMDELGDLARLVEIAPPDIAVLTKVGLAHYGTQFSSIAEIAKAKGEIFSHPKTKKAIVYHGFSECQIPYETISFSLLDREADYLFSGDFIDEKGIRAAHFDFPFSQPHVRYNFVCAAAVARSLAMTWDEIVTQIPQLTLPAMRFEQFEKEGIVFINDAYNANPESTMAALACMPEPQPGGKRIVVLGRMVNLGAFSHSSHEEVGRFAKGIADHLLTYAEEAAALFHAFAEGQKPAEHFLDLMALSLRLKDLMRPGDVVLVKGSRDLQMERVFELIGV